jgi:hypothetical protein
LRKEFCKTIDYRQGLFEDVVLRTHLILAVSLFYKGLILKQFINSIGLTEVAWWEYSTLLGCNVPAKLACQHCRAATGSLGEFELYVNSKFLLSKEWFLKSEAGRWRAMSRSYDGTR